MTVSELMRVLQEASKTFPTAQVKCQGWDAGGDLQDFTLRGDVRLDRDDVGNPVVVIR